MKCRTKSKRQRGRHPPPAERWPTVYITLLGALLGMLLGFMQAGGRHGYPYGPAEWLNCQTWDALVWAIFGAGVALCATRI